MPRYFLLRLQHLQFPVKVVRPEEIKLVSVLQATGLVEAEIAPALDRHGTYSPAHEAKVLCITEDGQTELAEFLAVRERSARRPPPAGSCATTTPNRQYQRPASRR